MSSDDAAYHRSVRNMSLVLAAIVITIFAAIFVPPYVNPNHDVFQSSVSMDSPFGFTLHLTINTTSPAPGSGVLIMGWLNSTSGSVENLTTANSWALDQNGLRGKICTSGWPIGVGVMKGHYTQDNYTLGTLIPLPRPLVSCPVQAAGPSYFLLKPQPHSSQAFVEIGGVPQVWTIQTSYAFGYAPNEGLPGGSGPNQLPSGVYTAVVADEWGEVLTTNFLVR
ncbi:MAG: hypothetical protein KGI38_06650 [Thaumarchaeota archaeon]|nr:hypothetical protein [Nitrososphaerota archaeon]